MSIRDWFSLLTPRSRNADAIAPTEAEQQKLNQFAAHADFEAGLAAYSVRDYTTAIARFKRVIAIRHDDADTHNNLGLSYLAAHQYEDALDAFVLSAHFRPRFPQAYYNMALATRAVGALDESVRYLEQAIEIKPDFVAAHNTLGYMLTHQTGDFAQGAAHIRTALSLDPADPDVLCNYGAVLVQEGNADEALKLCERLVKAYPDMHEARLNRALAKLKLGRFDTGWRDYEARKLAGGNYISRAITLPEWQGESLHRKKLLVYAEQGLGDQIMFASCLPDLLKRADSCLIECARPLASLFTRSFAPAMVVMQSGDAELLRTAEAAGMNYQVAIGSVPAQVRRNAEEFPPQAGFLRAEASRTDFWKARLDALGKGLKVGISWTGGAPSTRGANRSTRVVDWLPILQQQGCHFINLQYGSAGADLQPFRQLNPGLMLHDWPEAIVNYDETAALVAALDLVISVQTAVVHLAGALGTPAWVMLQAACEWRYGQHGESMPWYSSVRLFRQARQSEWNPVISDVTRHLSEMAKPCSGR
ncbi:MAG: hypothetical protein JWN94_308 [Betaproteobacteria bacterium]|nr:hypothetical protein [Betaproteobacteria bacterium]